MPDLPIDLEPALAERLSRHLDVEGKIPAALESLGPLSGRDVVLLGGGPLRARQLAAIGARVVAVDGAGTTDVPADSADVVVSLWGAFRGPDPDELREAERVLRPGGRLLVVHDYGRDDVSRLRGSDLPEYGAWSRRDGPFLANGWRIHVIHCWWTFDTIEEATAFLADAFGEPGVALGAGLRRPRLSYNVAVYHRSTAERG